MTKNGKNIRWTILVILLLCATTAGLPAAAPAHLGDVRSGDLAVINHRVPDEPLIENPALIRARTEPVVLFLDNGRSLKLAPNSAVRLEDSGSGTVEMKVLAGRVHLGGIQPGVHVVGAGSLIRIGPATRDETGLFLDGADPEGAARDRERPSRRPSRSGG